MRVTPPRKYLELTLNEKKVGRESKDVDVDAATMLIWFAADEICPCRCHFSLITSDRTQSLHACLFAHTFRYAVTLTKEALAYCQDAI
jgi:hypothetical protein